MSISTNSTEQRNDCDIYTNFKKSKQECDGIMHQGDGIKITTLKGLETFKVSNQKNEEIFVNKVFLTEAVKATVDDLPCVHTLEKNWNAGLSYDDNVKRFQTDLLNACFQAMRRLKENEDDILCIEHSVLVAFHVVCHLSIDSVKELTKRCAASCCNLVAKNGDYLQFICVLLNPENRGFLIWANRKVATKWLNLKKKIVKEFLHTKRNENTKDAEKLEFFESCLEILGCYQKKILTHEVNASETAPERIFSFPKNVEIPVGSDGNIYDRGRDPPGQRSVYIPPGDEEKETYRLSTFMRFPPEVPVNPRDLASFGFLYTGYKDRVKCFSCGMAVEDWTVADDVSLPRWHRSECPMMLQQECGNIPITRGIFAKPKPKYNPPVGAAGNKNGGASASPVASPLTHPKGIPAGQLLMQSNEGKAGPSNGWNQTAKPVAGLSLQSQPAPLARISFASMPSARHERLVKSLDLYKESDRLKTFDNWPVGTGTVQPSDLARSGFFYLGNLDRAQCFSCGGVLRNWKYGDVIDKEHQKHFPSCRMMNKTESSNVPLPPNENGSSQRSLRPLPDLSTSEKQNLQAMFPCLYPVNPHMRSEQVRFETFDRRWPRSRVNATPRQISNAGFFFLGERDKVKCWYCNGGLQNWDPDDQPWCEHAKWFPSCEFLLQQRGPDFVHRMVAMFPTLRRPVLRGNHDTSPHFTQSQVLRTNRRPPSPPPPMIDPKVELKRKKEELSKAIEDPITDSALKMGFTLKLVKKVLKKRFEEGNDMYKSVTDFVDELTIHDHQSDSSDEESENVPTTSSPGSRGGAASGMPILQLPGASQIGSSSSASTPTLTAASPQEGLPPTMVAKIQELQDERKCKICLDKKADVVFIPCGHLCSCTSCAVSLRKCPICRQKITKQMRTYIS